LIAGVDVNSVASIRTPTAFHVSAIDGTVLIATCSLTGSSLVLLDRDLTQPRTVEVKGIDYITCIAEAPGSGAIWVAGFEIPVQPPNEDVLDGSTVFREPDYRPMLARIPSGSTGPVDAVCLCDYTSGENDYLALPLSMICMPVGSPRIR
jgi:hypothetical protein